jgi:DNA uptake protein ComE-like DNA-binding protein
MKRIGVRLFLGLLTVLLAATITFAAPDDETSSLPPAKTATKKSPRKSSAKTNLVDINSATAGQLSALPGLTSVDAEKIIASRPYTRKNQLKQKNIITASTYDSIKSLIVAKTQTNKAASNPIGL